MRKVLVILVVLAFMGLALLHTCPAFELWLHYITGWY